MVWFFTIILFGIVCFMFYDESKKNDDEKPVSSSETRETEEIFDCRYRILGHKTLYGRRYEVQKRNFFGLWYNWQNMSGTGVGTFLTFDDAKKAIDMDKELHYKRVIYQD
jgi:hypothetical protein